MKLSVVLATKNEENNIRGCLASVQKIADEIVVVDEFSEDKTREAAREFGAKIFKNKHKNNFHESKQLAIEKAKGEWILQLDADERVSPALASEIKAVTNMTDSEIKAIKPVDKKKVKLFRRHQRILEKRDKAVGDRNGKIVAFFVPRQNYFLGKPLKYAGVYPDAVIRLFKAGKAYLPAKSVHEQMVVKGQVGWLYKNLEHHESPKLKRYLDRLNRYTDEHAKDLKTKSAPKNLIYLIYYSCFKGGLTFFKLYLRHKGFKDGLHGFVWSVYSAFHFPIAYAKYWNSKKQNV